MLIFLLFGLFEKVPSLTLITKELGKPWKLRGEGYAPLEMMKL